VHWWNLNIYFVNDADIKIVSFREPEVVILDNDPYSRVYNDLPAGHLVLRKIPICEYCGAIRLPNEGLNFCCRQGKVNIVSTPIPPDLCRLFTSQTDRDALYFKKNIRYFNSHFSFTSFGANVDHKVATAAGEHFTPISYFFYSIYNK
jgi:hypothetical protein